MANNVINKVIFIGAEDKVMRAIDALGDEFNLNNVVKEPDGLEGEISYYAVEAAKDYLENHSDENPEAYAKEKFAHYWGESASIKDDFFKCLENKKKYGCLWWYEWRMKNWGTKWNTYDHTGEFGVFFTANKPCREAYRRISEQFGITVRASYADEDMGCNCGIITAKNGVITEWTPESGSSEAELFALSVWNG